MAVIVRRVCQLVNLCYDVFAVRSYSEMQEDRDVEELEAVVRR